MSLIITNIQRFCVHDGPGIRTTVFLKGCTLRCPWCANPETVNSKIEYAVDETRCKRENNTCPINKECNWALDKKVCEKDYANCLVQAIKKIGKRITLTELMDILEKDEEYYADGGGITFSGGEPLLQLKENIEVLIEIKKRYNICVETAFCVNLDIPTICQYIDYLYIDLKTLISEDYKKIVNGDLNIMINNIQMLKKLKKKPEVIFRIPYIPDITNKNANIDAINKLIVEFPVKKIQVFKLHNLAKGKYKLLGRSFVQYKEVSKEELRMFISKINNAEVELLEI